VTSLHEREVDRLRAIDDLKAQQVAAWFGERLADAGVLAGRPTALSVLSDTDGLHGLRTRRSLEQMQQGYGYLSIELYDREGQRFAVAGAEMKGPSLLTGAMMTRSAKPGSRNSSTSTAPPTRSTRSGWPLPLPSTIWRGEFGGQGLCRTAHRSGAGAVSMIQTWPVPSASAETQLVRLEDDHVLYLNRLRHSLAEPMSVRLAMDPSLPAVQAIQNINAWGDGVDYRGVPVIFSSQVVPGTPWIMIAKVDRDEVLSGLRWASVAVGLSVFFLLLIAALLLLNRYRRQEYEQLVALSEQERYFHEVLDHSADAMLIVGSDSQIIYANGQAARLFDYRQEALLSMAWDRLLPRGENSSLDEFYQETVSSGQQTREIRMRTRDKRIIPSN
jgi:PAS domain S-box-containing protein